MKKKDNGLKAIVCLAAATVAVGVASIAVSGMDKTTATTPDSVVTPDGGSTSDSQGTTTQGSTAEKAGTTLSIEGASAKIKEARQNDDGTYTVVVAEEGFGGEMIIEAVYSADGKTLVSYDVVSHGETPGLGALVDEDDYKTMLAGVKLPVTVNGLDISAIIGVAKEEAPVVDTTSEAALKDGVYKAQTTADDKGNYAFVSVTIEGGKIVAVTWDEVNNGGLKSELSTTGKYAMKPVWATQAASVGKYVVDNQGTAGLLNEKGYTDVVSGVSINVAGFAGLADQAIAEANGKDGVYEVKGTADDKGNYAFVKVTVAGGKITEVVWDEVYNGGLKSELSLAGKYAMKPVWDTQAKSMCQYVVDNQGTSGLNLTDAGKTDAVSGVSISVNGFTGLVEECLAQAAATASYKDGVYEVKTDADDKGNYAFVSVTIEGGKITAVTWDEVNNGGLKSELSTTGKYVMKPVWATQAASVGKYVVDNQGTAGLLNEKGYTDVVSGVSINVANFAGLADQAIAEANGKDGVYEVKGTADDKGNYAFVKVTVAGGKITEVVWDEVYNGGLKSELSLAGKYAMKPVWDTQAKSMCQYVVDNQGTSGLNLTDAGKTDVVSGVSISVNGFTGLVEEALKQASVTGNIPAAAPAPAAPAVDATKVDIVSGATISSKAVIRAIDEGFVFLRDCVLNK